MPVLAAFLVVSVVYFLAIRSANPTPTLLEPPGHYGRLTEAILAGQTYLKQEPDQSLLALKNPYDNTQEALRMHDASLYKGRYYLYFGISPVLILLAPWRILFGNYLQEGVASGVFAWLGFFQAALLFVWIKDRFLPGLGGRWSFIGVIVLGLGNFALFIIYDTRVYPVAIMCAYACMMAAWLAFYRGMISASSRARLGWVGLMSTALGFAVGARPNMMFAVPVYLCGVWWMWRMPVDENGRTQDPNRDWCLLFPALIPLAVAAVGLAAYNYARFDSLFEFGVHWQLASYDPRNFKFLSLANIRSQLADTLVAPAVYSSYFPFLRYGGETFGAVSFAPLAIVGFLFPLTLLRRKFRGDPVWKASGMAGYLAVLCVFAVLCLYPFANARYSIDFLPALLVLGLWTAYAFIESSPTGSAWRRWKEAGVLCVLLWTLVHSVLLMLGNFSDTPLVAPLARGFNRVSYLAEQAFGVGYGPVKMKVTFPVIPVGKDQVLVSTGGGRDQICLRTDTEGKVRFSFFHLGAGGSAGDEIDGTPGVFHDVQIDFGSLYPPENHPIWNGWSREEVALLRRRAIVICDGKVVLHRDIAFYSSSPKDVGFGSQARSIAGTPRFTGSVKDITRLGIPSRDSISNENIGPIRIHLRLKPYEASYNEPLIASGTPQRGDLIYITYAGPNRIKFGHDHWNYSPYESPVVGMDSSVAHTIDIHASPLSDLPEGVAKGEIKFAIDGCDVFSVERPFNPSHPKFVSIGYNAVRGGTAAEIFGGPEFYFEKLPEMPGRQDPVGALNMGLRFNSKAVGTREPLLVTGVTGKGDMIYVVYESPTSVRFGYDHWGIAGGLSEPVAVVPGDIHIIRISLGSLFPAIEGKSWGEVPRAEREKRLTTFSLAMDGVIVLEKSLVPHPTTSEQVTVGKNRIGGSSSGPEFTGEIISRHYEGIGDTP